MALSRDNNQAAVEVVDIYNDLKRHSHEAQQRMNEMCKAYNGTLAVVLPDLDANEKPAIANLLGLGIDQFAQRVGSVMPNLEYPSLRPGMKNSDLKADIRRKAALGWWEMNSLSTKIRRRARYMVAYGTSPVSLSPVALTPLDKREMPFWRVRNPLNTYAAPMIDPDDMEPPFCVFVDVRPLSWLYANYPDQTMNLSKGDDSDTDMFEVLEYVDDVETVLVVIGKARHEEPYQRGAANRGMAMQQTLGRVPNRMGICPVVMPGRITLDRLQGQFDQALGIYQRQAKLDALATIAVFRNVFPNEWIQSSNGRPKVIRAANGRLGVRGEIENGELNVVHISPDMNSSQLQDRYERAMRITAGVQAQMGGENPTNVRTAKASGELLGDSIDMTLQEVQETFAKSLQRENTRAAVLMKEYYGSKPTMFFFDYDGKITRPDYTPNDAFDTTANKVEYPMPGSDVQSMVVQIGQLVGIKAMSTFTAMTLLPQIKDAIAERDMIQVEGLRAALMSWLEQGMVAGTVSGQMGARVITMMMSDHTPIEESIVAIHQQMQQEQAAQAQQAQQQQPGETPAPDQQPGGATDQVPPPNGGQPAAPSQPGDLASLLANLHVPLNTSGNAPTAPAHVSVGQ
jgi:uncharacterized protein YjhX (UPF0386 family)